MGMCKKCKQVVNFTEMKEGCCLDCIEKYPELLQKNNKIEEGEIIKYLKERDERIARERKESDINFYLLVILFPIISFVMIIMSAS